MAVYNFERFSVLIVEDNKYIRNVAEDLFRHFQFGRIMTAANGAEAIDFLKAVYHGAHGAGNLGLDLVISDLVMSPINGLLFLRWMRTAKESPNRFIPFVMLSGAADAEYVNSARDLGVTEFLAKPFSAQTLYKHLLEVIDYPRQFIMSHNYFGPDRRRRELPPPDGEDRRQTTDAAITVVYSSDKVVRPKKGSDEVWNFRLPNRLREKGAFGLTAAAMSEPGEMPSALLEEAEQKLERAALDFSEWALGYLSKLSDLCTEALMKPGRRAKHFEEINLLAHELRGQGGTFGYPLISVFGKSLYDVTGPGCREDDSAVEIVKAHIDAMRAVLRDKIAGDGGQLGRELIKSLRAAISKYSNQRQTVG